MVSASIRRRPQDSVTVDVGGPNGSVTPTPVGFDPARAQTRLSYLQRLRPNDPQIALLKKQLAAQQPTTPQQPVTQTPPPDTTTQQPPADTSGQQTGNTGTATDINALFPNINSFEPSNYQGSPLYQFQQQQGQKQLERLYAARGLTGSGAEIAGNAQFLNQLGAQEANRVQDIAQLEANRLQQMQEAESNRRAQAGQNQFQNLYNLLSLASNQSPINADTTGVGNATNVLQAIGSDQQKVLSDLYNRIYAGGGRVGMGMPAFVAPFPSSPDFTGADIAKASAGQQSGTQWGNVISSVLGSILGQAR